MPSRAGTNGMAVTSLVCGIVGVVLCPFVPSILAVVFSVVAKNQIRDSSGAQGGAGMATAGLVLGIIGVAFWAILLAAGAFSN